MHQASDEVVGARLGEVQPIAHGGDRDDGPLEEPFPNSFATRAAEGLGAPGALLSAHAEEGGTHLGGLAAEGDDPEKEHRTPFPAATPAHDRHPLEMDCPGSLACPRSGQVRYSLF